MRFLSQTKRATLKAASLLLVAAVATPTLAADAAPMKIAVLDMGGALFNSERAKAVDAEIEAQTSEDQAKLRSIQEQAQKINTRLQQDAAVMSDEEKRKAQTELQDLSVQYQAVGERVQGLLQQRRDQFQQQHAQALIQAIQTVIDEGKYDVVIRSEAALFFNTALDITPRVTEKLNQQP
jgi:outer membrane protein